MIYIQNLKTTEFTKETLEMIRLGFNEVFQQDRAFEVMKNQYVKNPLGYSFHTVVFDDERVIGHLAAVPAYYLCNGERVLFVDGVDEFILKQYRDGEIFLDLTQNFFKYLKQNGVKLLLGVPDKAVMKLYAKTKIYKKLGNLDTYILPYAIGGIKPALNFLNPLSKWFCRVYVNVSSWLASDRCQEYMIEKEASTYNATRYQRMDGRYSEVKCDNMEFYYKIEEFRGVRAAFLIDVVGKSAKHFSRAVQYIIKRDAGKFDVILYVGNLPFKHHGLIKVPHRFAPKEFNVILKFFDKSMYNKDVMNIAHWDLNLSSYDVI